jgi:chaperonin GroEL
VAAWPCSMPPKVLARLKPGNHVQQVGIDIVRRAIQAPARQIVENAGSDGSVVVGKLLESSDTNYGYDAQSGEYVNMVKAGIIDPTKVVHLGLQGAASVASLLVTTEAMVAERPEKRESAPQMPTGGGMGGMDF